MKWLGLIAVLALAGCQEDILEPKNEKPEDANGGSQTTAPATGDRKSFSARPNELKTVLAELRDQTGWKLTCEPELEKELVYLKFKDKTEQEVAMALGQVLLANFPQKLDAMTLSAEHAATINKTMFQNEIFRYRIQPPMEALQKAAAKMIFKPGYAADKVKDDVRFLKSLKERDAEAERRLQTLSPSSRACLEVIQLLDPGEFAMLKMDEPKVWATDPGANQTKMTAEMEAAIDRFVQQSIEWNGALQAAKARGASHPGLPQPVLFSPRADFEFKIQRGDPETSDTTKSFRCLLTLKEDNGFGQVLGQLVVPIEQLKVPSKSKPNPDFTKEIQKLLPTEMYQGFGHSIKEKPPEGPAPVEVEWDGDVRLKLLATTLEFSSKHKDNVVANLSSQVLEKMARLTMGGRRWTPTPGDLDPDAILLEDHVKFDTPDWVQYRPYFTIYERLDRGYWEKRGSGIANSPWSKAPVKPDPSKEPLVIE